MTEELIPPVVRDFILKHIDSVAALEALLLLRERPDRSWAIAEIASRLYIDRVAAENVLRGLCADQILECDGETYRYAPKTAGHREVIDKLAAVYSRYLVPVTHIIHHKPLRIQKFADAFKFRKED